MFTLDTHNYMQVIFIAVAELSKHRLIHHFVFKSVKCLLKALILHAKKELKM